MIKKTVRKLLALVLTLGMLTSLTPQPASAIGPFEHDLVLYVHIDGTNSYNTAEYNLQDFANTILVTNSSTNEIYPAVFNYNASSLTYQVPKGTYSVQFNSTAISRLGFSLGGGPVHAETTTEYLTRGFNHSFTTDGYGILENYLNFIPTTSPEIQQTETPTVRALLAGATTVSGQSEPHAVVYVTLNGQTHSGNANADGAYSIQVPALRAGDSVVVTAKAAEKTLSNGNSVTVGDLATTTTPTITQPKAGDTVITGQTEPNASVTVTTPAGSYTSTADAAGNYRIPVPALAANDEVSVQAHASGKNPSTPQEATTQAVTQNQTAQPTVRSPQAGDTVVSGTTEPNARVTVTTPQGSYAATATGTGTYNVPVPALNGGDPISVTAQAEGKTVSPAVQRTTTAVTQNVTATPTINALTVGSTTVRGTAEPGAAVTVQTPNGTYTTTADAEGNYSVSVPALKAGTAVSVKAKAPDKLESRTALAGVAGTGTTGPIDSDSDGYTDALEIEKGTDPYDANSFPVVETVVTIPGGGTETIYVPVEKDVIVHVNSHRSYISGYPDGSFGADRPITRAEVAAIMTRIDSGAASAENSFPDVTATDWYASSVSYVSGQGVMGGYPDGTFRPNEAITRAEVASLLQRYKNLSQGSANPFNDITGHWAYQSILDVS